MLNPHRLWSLWDMLRFYAHSFMSLSRMLGNVEGQSERSHAQALDHPIPAPQRENCLKSFGDLTGEVENLDLDVSTGFYKSLVNVFKSQSATFRDMQVAMSQFQNSMQIELKQRIFLGLSPHEAVYFNTGSKLLGEDVEKKIDAVVEDVSEASRCMAMGVYTACVFHLMRVMEVGVQKFGEKLGIKLIEPKSGSPKLWHNILDEANKAIKALNQNDAMTKKLALISSNLYSVKLAWRNEVMHPKATYTEDEAKNVIVAVKAFMNELASVI